VLIGAALSLSGAVYQGVFHNPLVSPDILGVSSGAAVGASLAIIAHFGTALIQLFALIFVDFSAKQTPIFVDNPAFMCYPLDMGG
jgi:ABC-type Fe3+-siderophore transport system permease subunit